jgi:hypothetical protein
MCVWLRTSAIGAALVFVVAAAALFTWGRPQNAYPLPTSGYPEGVGMQAGFEGKVVGDVRTGCLTLGSGGALAVWPKGFYAIDDPPRVVRPNGEVAVRVGERVRMGGGNPNRKARKYGTTIRWIVSEVEPLRD